MKFIFYVLSIFAFACLSARGQTDPLNVAYKPSIDTNCADYPNGTTVQMTGPLVKLRADESFSDLSTQGGACGLTIMLTQNEMQGFWIHVKGGASGVTNLSVSWSTVPAKTTGPGGNASFCGSAADCLIYSLFYNTVSSQSGLSCSHANACNATGINLYTVTGAYGDQLIPKVDPYYGQTTNAFPENVAANTNQSVWVDMHAPCSTPAGFYLGQIQVTGNGGTLATMPVLYGVWQWPQSQGTCMPSTSSLKNHYDIVQSGTGRFCNQVFGGTGFNNCTSYPGGLNANVVDGMVVLLDHKVSPDPHNTDQLAPNTGSFTGFNTWYGPLFNGTTAHVTGILSGAKLTSRTLVCPGGNTAACFTNWVSEFQTQGWLSTLFFYPCDEPPAGCSWATLISTATSERGWSNPIVPILTTTNFHDSNANSALNATDWMISELFSMDGGNNLTSPNSANQRSTYNTWLTGTGCVGCPTRRVGQYIDNLQSGAVDYPSWPWTYSQPNLAIDGLPVANRTMPWVDFFNIAPFDLYFAVDQGMRDGVNPWTASGLLSQTSFGDGTLVYPCSASMTTGHYCGVTIPIWIPSLRLKYIRDGYEDFEYLNVLTNLGQSAFVNAEVATWMTGIHAFNTNPISPAGGFSGDITDARIALGNQMHSISFPNVVPAPAPTMLVMRIH